jgi:hypothetical protein
MILPLLSLEVHDCQQPLSGPGMAKLAEHWNCVRSISAAWEAQTDVGSMAQVFGYKFSTQRELSLCLIHLQKEGGGDYISSTSRTNSSKEPYGFREPHVSHIRSV